jgi:preprotein translocase subunit SecD
MSDDDSARRFRRHTAAVAVAALALGLPAACGGQPSAEPAPPATTSLTYRVEPSAAELTARVVRERLAAAAIHGAKVTVPSSASLRITAPAGALADVEALAQRGRVALYDWEHSVLGPRGRPAPRDAGVTGGAHAGWTAATTRARAEARAARLADGLVVRAESAEHWFALGGDPALTDADIARAGSAVDPGSQQPAVWIEFTARGQRAFTMLTRALARRARARAVAGAGDAEAVQHFAVVLDDQIVAVPRIDFRATPDGIDGSTGAQIEGGLMPLEARRIAAILNSGPLPNVALRLTRRGQPRAM